MDISWEDAKLFLAVAENGSVSGAARALRLGQPTVTRRLALLEYAVGKALFHRSPKGVALTAAGERLMTPARKMAEWAGELNRAAEAADGSPKGLVRITASPFACFDFVAPFAGLVAQKNPGLRLEVLSAIQYLDLGRGEADLAIRGRPASHDDLMTIHSWSMPNAVFVSESLKAKLPRKPDFASLPWVAWSPPYQAVVPNPQLEALIPNFTPAFTADHYLVQLSAAEAGLGAMVMPRTLHRFSRKSRLVPLDLDLGPHATTSTYVVCAKSALDIPRVRRVADLLVAEIKQFKRA